MKYFAYGSNMDTDQMTARCPGSQLIGKAALRDYRLDFTYFSDARQCNCADIIAAEGSQVWGLLYEVSASDLANLDRIEGHPTEYKRFQVAVYDEHGVEHVAYTYEVVTKQGHLLPTSAEYLNLLQKAAARFAFPDDYQKMIAAIQVASPIIAYPQEPAAGL